MKDRSWYCHPSNAIDGDGLFEGEPESSPQSRPATSTDVSPMSDCRAELAVSEHQGSKVNLDARLHDLKGRPARCDAFVSVYPSCLRRFYSSPRRSFRALFCATSSALCVCVCLTHSALYAVTWHQLAFPIYLSVYPLASVLYNSPQSSDVSGFSGLAERQVTAQECRSTRRLLQRFEFARV